MRVPIVAAPLLCAFHLTNLKLGRKLPDGWMVSVVGTGVVTYIVEIGGLILAMESAERILFAADLFALPQPFVAGALVGGVYAVALPVIRRLAQAGR